MVDYLWFFNGLFVYIFFVELVFVVNLGGFVVDVFDFVVLVFFFGYVVDFVFEYLNYCFFGIFGIFVGSIYWF